MLEITKLECNARKITSLQFLTEKYVEISCNLSATLDKSLTMDTSPKDRRPYSGVT